MGLITSKFYDLWELFSGSLAKVVMVGLDAAGKTTILYRLKLDKVVTTIPTIGFNVETVTPCKGLTLTIWDLFSQDKARPLWQHYCHDAAGVIFVVDSADEERFSEAKEELHKILENESVRRVPVLVLANKQDLVKARPVSVLTDVLDLPKLTSTQKWHIQPCSAQTGEGLIEGFTWFSDAIKEHKKLS